LRPIKSGILRESGIFGYFALVRLLPPQQQNPRWH